MKLSLADAARLMGKSQRQLRYLIQQGGLKASKASGRWEIDREDLPLTEGQRQAAVARGEQIKHEVEQALAPAAAAATKGAGGRGRFSVRRLRAFMAGEPLFRDLVACAGPQASAVVCLKDSLRALARGCHAFHPARKAEHYRQARELGADALVELLLEGPTGDEQRQGLADRLEQEFLPQLSGLLRGTERAAQRGRFDRFASGRAPSSSR